MKLSVITINWNNFEGLKGTVESVINQTYDDFEYIVIDGGSTDGSAEYLEQNKEYFAYLVSEPDKGVYNAMNKGVAKAKGEYCLFMNSGDELIDNGILKKIFAIIHKDKSYDFIYGDVLFTRRGKIISKTNITRDITGLYLYKSTIPHQSILIKSKLLINNKYDESYKIISDWAHMFECIVMKNATTKKIDLFISKYDVTGISSTNYYLTAQERDHFLSKILPDRIKSDYNRMLYGKTLLERVICRLRKKSFGYRLITLLSLVVFAPISITRRGCLLLSNVKKKLQS